MHGLLLFFHMASCFLLVIVVLLQPDRGDGMAGAFGGMGGSVAFGVKTLDVMWKATIVLAGIFMFTALGLTCMDQGGEALQPKPPPVSTPAP